MRFMLNKYEFNFIVSDFEPIKAQGVKVIFCLSVTFERIRKEFVSLAYLSYLFIVSDMHTNLAGKDSVIIGFRINFIKSSHLEEHFLILSKKKGTCDFS